MLSPTRARTGHTSRTRKHTNRLRRNPYTRLDLSVVLLLFYTKWRVRVWDFSVRRWWIRRKLISNNRQTRRMTLWAANYLFPACTRASLWSNIVHWILKAFYRSKRWRGGWGRGERKKNNNNKKEIPLILHSCTYARVSRGIIVVLYLIVYSYNKKKKLWHSTHFYDVQLMLKKTKIQFRRYNNNIVAVPDGAIITSGKKWYKVRTATHGIHHRNVTLLLRCFANRFSFIVPKLSFYVTAEWNVYAASSFLTDVIRNNNYFKNLKMLFNAKVFTYTIHTRGEWRGPRVFLIWLWHVIKMNFRSA